MSQFLSRLSAFTQSAAPSAFAMRSRGSTSWREGDDVVLAENRETASFDFLSTGDRFDRMMDNRFRNAIT
jgi:hypothetical protein